MSSSQSTAIGVDTWKFGRRVYSLERGYYVIMNDRVMSSRTGRGRKVTEGTNEPNIRRYVNMNVDELASMAEKLQNANLGDNTVAIYDDDVDLDTIASDSNDDAFVVAKVDDKYLVVDL